jgi:hypothetical protein
VAPAQEEALDELRQVKPKPYLQSALQSLDFEQLFADVTRKGSRNGGTNRTHRKKNE